MNPENEGSAGSMRRSPDSAQRLAGGLQRAWQVRKSGEDESGDAVGAMLAPQTLDQLVWLGLDADSVGRLRPFVDLLPEPTPLNINTATPEVLAAVVAGLDVASAKRVESKRPYRRLQDASSDITIAGALDPKRLSVGSSYFVISGRLRMEGRVLEERMLVRRDNREVVQVARWRQSLQPNDE